MLLLYTYTNIDNAKDLGDRMMKDTEDLLPGHSRDLCFMMGVK